MDRREAREKLKALTPRQTEVLRHFCLGRPYKEIADILVIDEKTVRVHMGNIYIKLDLEYLDIPERRRLLYQVFCPVLNEDVPRSLVADYQDEEEPPPVSEDLLKKVEADEYALVPVEPITISTGEEGGNGGGNGGRRGCLRAILGGAALIILTLFVLNWLGLLDTSGIFAQDEPTASVEPSEVVEADIDEPISTTPPPTPTAEVPTETLTPTSTLRPTATPFPLPFTDNFDNGAKSEWDFYGNWLVTDGRLTVIFENTEYLTALLDITGWQNYRVEVDLNIPNYGSSNTGETVIFVRQNTETGKFIGFYQDYFGRGSWALWPTNYSDPEPVSLDQDMYSIPQGATFRLDVIDNQFTAYVNGVLTQQISLTGFDNSLIMLAIQCKGTASCPSFDNFSIEPLD